MKTVFALTLAGALAVSGLAFAQSPHHGGGKAASGGSAATKAFRATNDKTHKAMDLKYTNDADVDFIRGMIPHHQGAVDMAKVALDHGKDEQTRKWAADIIREQEREIAEMQEWLKSRKK